MSELYNFQRFKPGDSIEIDFDATEIEGIEINPRTHTKATLKDPALATVLVDEASPELGMDMTEIGLAVNAEVFIPQKT